MFKHGGARASGTVGEDGEEEKREESKDRNKKTMKKTINKKMGQHLHRTFTESHHLIFPVECPRARREQHVPDSL